MIHSLPSINFTIYKFTKEPQNRPKNGLHASFKKKTSGKKLKNRPNQGDFFEKTAPQPVRPTPKVG